MLSMTSLIYFIVRLPLLAKRKKSMFPTTPSYSSRSKCQSLSSVQTLTTRKNFETKLEKEAIDRTVRRTRSVRNYEPVI
jgi:hypothetical protein